MNQNTLVKRPNCFECEHFYVTWDPKFPRGCNAFGFKTATLPSYDVFQSSGEECNLFSPKNVEQKTKPPP